MHGLPGKSTKERVMRRILMLVFLLFSVSDEGLDNWWGEFLCLFSSYSQYLMRDWIIHAWSEIEHAVYSRVSHRQESQFQKIVRRNIYRYLRSFVRSSACSCKRSESNTANVNKLKCLSFTHQVALGQRCRFGFLQQIVGNGQAFPRQRGVIFLKIKNKISHPSQFEN